MKTYVLVLVAMFIMSFFVGCISEDKAIKGSEGKSSNEIVSDDAEEVRTEQKEELIESEKVGHKVGLVLTLEGLGDQGFNDLVYQGIERAEQELGVPFDYVSPESVSDYEMIIEEMAMSSEYDLIITISYEAVDAISKIAPRYPEQNFAIIDPIVEGQNILSVVAKEEEGSFLVGALAAYMKTANGNERLNDGKTLGVIGAIDLPVINRFFAGFIAGAKYVDPEFNVLVDYVGGFSDKATAKVIANDMYDKGADIIYYAAGESGIGVVEAAVERDLFAIGVDTNNNGLAPDNMLASMVKRVDSGAFMLVYMVVEDTFGPGVLRLGLKQDGVGYVLDGSNIIVPEEIVEQVEELRKSIVNGDIVVSDTLDGLQ